MAVTKIWPIRDSVRRVVEYAENAEKTQFSDIQAVLHYTENGRKTVIGEEKTMYVTGINCSRENACQEMEAVQKRFDKSTGIVAYHAYQSFKTGEVTPELCHRLGVELAKKMWGDQYQVVVATHFNTGTYHNHFVINAVNMWDGKKFICNKGTYFRFRSLSDELCRENQLTVIKNPSGKTPRSIYFAEKNGEPTKYNLMREAIDYAVTISSTWEVFMKTMVKLGYRIQPDRRYSTIRSVHSRKAVRMYHLGDDYTPDSIRDRITERVRTVSFEERSDAVWEFRDRMERPRKTPLRRYRVKGSFLSLPKITGIRALYFHYCCLLKGSSNDRFHRPLSPEMREAWRRIDQITRDVQLINNENFTTLADAEAFIESSKQQISTITEYRTKIYNKLRRCSDPDEDRSLRSKRDDCTSALKDLRRDIKTAEHIISRNPEIKHQIAIEEDMRRTLSPLHKKMEKNRGYER